MTAASAACMPLAANAAAMKRARSSWRTRIGSTVAYFTGFPVDWTHCRAASARTVRASIRAGNPLSARSRGGSRGAGARAPHRKVGVEPVAHDRPDALVVLRECEVVEAAEQMQLGRLPGAPEQLDRLLRRCH